MNIENIAEAMAETVERFANDNGINMDSDLIWGDLFDEFKSELEMIVFCSACSAIGGRC